MRRYLIPVVVLVAVLVAACSDEPSVFDQGGATTIGPATTGAATTEAATTTAAVTTTLVAETTLGGGEQAMADQIATELLAQNDLGLPLDQATAQCLGDQIVSVIGLARLQALEEASGGAGDLGAALELMTPEEQATLVGVILQGTGGQPACLNVRSLLMDALAESGLSESSAACVADAFTQGTMLQEVLAAGLSGGEEGEMNPEVMSQLLTVMMGCLSPEELAEMGGLDLGS